MGALREGRDEHPAHCSFLDVRRGKMGGLCRKTQARAAQPTAVARIIGSKVVFIVNI